MFKKWLLCNTMQVTDDLQFFGTIIWNFAQGWNVDFIYRSLVKEKSGEVVMELIALEEAKKWD